MRAWRSDVALRALVAQTEGPATPAEFSPVSALTTLFGRTVAYIIWPRVHTALGNQRCAQLAQAHEGEDTLARVPQRRVPLLACPLCALRSGRLGGGSRRHTSMVVPGDRSHRHLWSECGGWLALQAALGAREGGEGGRPGVVPTSRCD